MTIMAYLFYHHTQIITSNIFLFLIAIFSFYLAFAGMRFARNRKGVATILDWIAICLMIFSGIGMWVLIKEDIKKIIPIRLKIL